MGSIGKILIILGVVLLAAGAVFLLAGRVPWIGRLPGDICIKRDNFTLYFPLTTCLLLSAALTLLFYIFRR